MTMMVMMNKEIAKEIEKMKKELSRYKSDGPVHLKDLRQYMQDSSAWLDTKVSK